MAEFDLNSRFKEAVALAETIPQDSLPQDVQLRLYAFYKQATIGTVDTRMNVNLDLRNAFKTNAWMQISHLTTDQAKEKYIEAITALKQP